MPTTDLPYAAEAESSLSYEELEVSGDGGIGKGDGAGRVSVRVMSRIISTSMSFYNDDGIRSGPRSTCISYGVHCSSTTGPQDAIL
jgi:hypothetical protein